MWRKQKWNKEWEQNNKNAIVPLYSLEQIKEQLWDIGVYIPVYDLRVLIKYLIKCKKVKSKFVVSYNDYFKLKDILTK